MMEHDPKELRELSEEYLQEGRRHLAECLDSYADLIERHAKLEWLAAAVEGPEEATPETRANSIKLSRNMQADIGEEWDYVSPTFFCEILERQRNAALRALKAERERYEKLKEYAERVVALAAQARFDAGESEDARDNAINAYRAALAAQEGRHD